jgi:hypothetical protein
LQSDNGPVFVEPPTMEREEASFRFATGAEEEAGGRFALQCIGNGNADSASGGVAARNDL